MKKLIISMTLLLCTIALHAQTSFYYNQEWKAVIVVYFSSSNRIVFTTETGYNMVRERLMSDMNTYEKALSKRANHGASYDMNDNIIDTNLGSAVICCDFYQTLSGYNIYGRMFKPAFMYGDYQKVLELGISGDKNTIVRDITANEHRYFSRVEKSFFLPSL